MSGYLGPPYTTQYYQILIVMYCKMIVLFNLFLASLGGNLVGYYAQYV